MAKRLMTQYLIDRNDINEELRKVNNSKNGYVTPTGQVYLEYEPNKFYKIKTGSIHGYIYATLDLEDGTRKNFRVHRLVAQAYIHNPDNLPIVGHKNNIKDDNRVENLYWTTVAQNTKDAYRDNLIYNASSWDDSQSIPVVKFDLDYNYICEYGSIGEASKYNNITKTAICGQCKHLQKTKPRKGFYYRYKEEFDNFGFVL